MPGEQANTVLRVIAGEATYKHRHTHLSATANLQNGTVAAILEHSDRPNEWKTHSPYLPPYPAHCSAYTSSCSSSSHHPNQLR